MRATETLLGGPLVAGHERRDDELVLRPIDATLGVPGLPQSATGQTTLFTGINAAAHMGRHVPAFPGPRLRALIESHGLLRALRDAGRQVTFLNAFSPRYFEELAARRRRASVTLVLTQSAGLETRTIEQLAARQAVSWDLSRDVLSRALGSDLPRLDPEEAAGDIGRLAGDYDLTLFETFLPDLAGHRRLLDAAEVLRRIDALVGGVVRSMPADATLVLTSDHGNLEESGHHRHTRNPVPLLAIGPQAHRFAEVGDLSGVSAVVRAVLGLPPQPVSPGRPPPSREVPN